MNSRLRITSVLALSAALLAGCAKKAEESTANVFPIAEAYYHAHPEFFHFKTIADLPANLRWIDGHDAIPFADPAAKHGGTIRFREPDFPRTLRYYGPDANGTFRPYILDDVAIQLIMRQPNTGQDYPGLAREWAYDPDKRTMYFRLDPDARYSDGRPVRTDDFLFLFYFMKSPYLQDPWSNNFYSTYFTGITKYDDLTFAMTWYEPKPDLDQRLGSMIPLDEEFYKEFGPDYLSRYQWRVEPTTGAYTVRPEDIHKGVSIDTTYVPNWWAADKPMFRHRYNVDRIHFVIIRDEDKAAEAFKHGDFDTLKLASSKGWYTDVPDSLPLVQHGAIAKFSSYNILPCPTFAFSLNRSDPLLANHDIRVGINYACNFDLVDKEVFRGDWVRMQTSSDGYSEVPFPNIHPRPFSVERALAAFAKAGFDHRGPDGVLVDAHGRRLSFTITTPYERMRDALTVIRQQGLKAGVEFKLEILDFTTAFKKINEKHHQIGFVALNVAFERYPRYWEYFKSTQANRPDSNNATNMADPAMDALIDKYDRAETMDEIRQYATRIEQRVYDDAAYIPAFKLPVIRGAYWRYVRFPAHVATRESSDLAGNNGLDFGRFWIDESMRAKVKAAADGTAPMPPEITVDTTWKTP